MAQRTWPQAWAEHQRLMRTNRRLRWTVRAWQTALAATLLAMIIVWLRT